MNRDQYVAQVELLLDCLPALKEQEIFALKGGTAINFFIRNLPIDNLENLPALKWKIMNIQTMNKDKHQTMLKKLTVVLER